MKAWECSACGGKSFTQLNANTIMCDYCETRFTLDEQPKSAGVQDSPELRRAKITALVAQANALHEQEKYQEEIKPLMEALELDEQNSEVWTKLGRAYRLNNLHDDALRCYQQALKLDPNNGPAYGNIGVVYQLKGDYESSVRYLKHAMSLCDPNGSDYTVMMANLALATYKGGNHAEGIRLIDEAERRGYANAAAAREQMGIKKVLTAAEKQQAQSLKRQAQQFYKKEQYAQAVPLLQQATGIDPSDSEAWTQLGRAHRLTSNPDEALRCYQKALQIDPNNGSAYGNIGVLCHQRGDYAQAIQHYKKALNMLPANSADRGTMTANLAMSTYLSGDHKNGERLLNEAERLGYRNGAAARQQLGIKKSGLFGGLFK